MTNILVSLDTAPSILGIITDTTTGDPIDLTGATVYFQLRLATERRFRIDALCTITDAAHGEVRYDLLAGDLDFDGECYGRFLVIYSDLRRQHTIPQLPISIELQ